MNKQTKTRLRKLHARISSDFAEIAQIREGCGSWFSTDGETESIRCGEGEGLCPNCKLPRRESKIIFEDMEEVPQEGENGESQEEGEAEASEEG